MSFEEFFHAVGLLTPPYSSSPESDLLILEFLVTLLHVVKGYSLDDIASFTTYHFINLASRAYCKWEPFTDFEANLARLYFHFIRGNWMQKGDDSVLVSCPSSPSTVYLSGSFFVNVGGRPWAVNSSIAADLLSESPLSELHKLQHATTSRPRRLRTLSVSNLRDCVLAKQHVYERCLLQQWTGIDVNEVCLGGRGRGIVTAKAFKRGEIIVDYHARQITREEAESIIDNEDDERSNFLFCAPGGRFWDGSSESCVCHPQSRLLGRLTNFAQKNSKECNATPQLFQYHVAKKPANDTIFNAIILVATRDIAVEEEVRFDYGDKGCLELFS